MTYTFQNGVFQTLLRHLAFLIIKKIKGCKMRGEVVQNASKAPVVWRCQDFPVQLKELARKQRCHLSTSVMALICLAAKQKCPIYE